MRGAAALVLALGVSGCGSPALFAGPTSLTEFEFTDAEAWSLGHEGDRVTLDLTGPSDYAPPHRSPLSIALLPPEVEGFVLDLQAQQTGREYGHRDLCLFFGYRSAAHFYYVHLASQPDERAHNLFLVDGADRRNLLEVQDQGVDWGQGWHRLRLRYDARRGEVAVHMDDLETPLFRAAGIEARGRVGVGSFDDRGRFAAIELRELD